MAGLNRCKNPACEHHGQCRFASVPSAGQVGATDDCPKLTIAPNGLGRIHLNQSIGPALAPLIVELAELDPALVPGFLILILSGGGNGSWGDKLIWAITEYRRKGGVAVSLIETAFSCAFEMAVVCNKAFALPDGLGGHVGCSRILLRWLGTGSLAEFTNARKVKRWCNQAPREF